MNKNLIQTIYDDTVVVNEEDLCGESLGEYFSRWLDDERFNLNVPAWGIGKKYHDDACIVAFSDCGFWNGRRDGGRVFGYYVNSILPGWQKEDYEFNYFCDKYNVRAEMHHHDGCHHVLFRVAKSVEDAERIVDAIASGRMTEKQFRKATRSLRPAVAKIYGW